MSEDPYIIVGTDTARRLIKPSRQRWVLPAAGGAALLVAGIVTLATLLTAFSLPTIPVQRGDIIWSYVASGRVETETTVEIVPKISAPIQAIHVKEGAKVRRGQLIVTLRDETLAARYQEAIRSREAAQAQWNKVRRGTRRELIDQASAQWKEAKAEVRRWEALRDRILRGALSEEKDQAEARLTQTEAELQFARDEWNRVEKLRRDQVVTQREIDEARRRLDTAKAKVLHATANRDLIVRGATKEEKEEAKAAVAVAEAKGEQAEANLARLKAGATDEEKKVAEAEVKKAEATVQRLEAQSAQLEIHSPISGIVLRRYKAPGELTFPQMRDPILVIAESGEKKFRIEVLEQDIYKIRENQELEVTSDSYPGRSWKATVTRIAPVLGKKRLSSESPKQKYDVKVLEVWLTPGEPLDLPVNLPVEALLKWIVRENVLILPARAVDPSGHVYFDREERRAVETGVRDDAYVEILSGLEEGDAIWIP